MATFSCSVSASSPTSASVTASFTGGDAAFDDFRKIVVSVGGSEYDFRAQQHGGANNTFSGTITDLQPGTGYHYTVLLYYYYDGDGTWIRTSYSASGSFRTPDPPPSTSGSYIYGTKNGVTKWWPATAYVYASGQWNPATAHIYNNGGWS